MKHRKICKQLLRGFEAASDICVSPVQQFSSRNQFSDDVDPFIRFDDIVQSDTVGMVHLLGGETWS
jgi:hypothetical protein